jgi:hypothetical protein
MDTFEITKSTKRKTVGGERNIEPIFNLQNDDLRELKHEMKLASETDITFHMYSTTKKRKNRDPTLTSNTIISKPNKNTQIIHSKYSDESTIICSKINNLN